MRRLLLGLPLLTILSACGNSAPDLGRPADPIGDFQFGFAGVVAPNLQRLLVSRDATGEEWIDAINDAIDQRFSRYEGDKFYHFGISVEAYSLPPPVIPGKSALALNVTLWDDAAHAKMNTEPKQIQIIRVLESRLASTKETQIEWLAIEAAKMIEDWMREMQVNDGWFGGPNTSTADPDAAEEPEQEAVAVVADPGPVTVPDNVQSALTAAQTPAQPQQ